VMFATKSILKNGGHPLQLLRSMFQTVDEGRSLHNDYHALEGSGGRLGNYTRLPEPDTLDLWWWEGDFAPTNGHSKRNHTRYEFACC
jgi:hypothetical protein